MNNINPFNLFGIDNLENLNIKNLKKKYYELALICHPDKGGSDEDILIVYNSYLYIKNQLENKNKFLKNNSFIHSKLNFNEYMKLYKQKPPPFYETWLESEDYKKHELFNKQFEQIHKSSLLSNGYGNLMDESNINSRFLDKLYYKIFKYYKLPKNIIKLILLYINCSNNIFINDNKNNKLILYNKFEYCHNYERIDGKEIKDFTSKLYNCNSKNNYSQNNNLQLNDYKLAHSVNNSIFNMKINIKSRTLKELIKEREESLKDIFNN